MFSDLLQKDLFKGKWSFAKSSSLSRPVLLRNFTFNIDTCAHRNVVLYFSRPVFDLMTMNDLRILEFMAESLHEWIILQSLKNSRIFDRLISVQPRVFLRKGEPKKSFQRYLALFRDELDSKVKCKESILEVLFVQYLPESNCGFVEFLCLQYGENQDEIHSINCGWRKKLMKEAEGVLNKVRIAIKL